MTHIKGTYTFRWVCPHCKEDQPEYIVEGSPKLEVLCERCSRWSQYEELTTEEQVAWDIAIEREAVS